MTRVEIVSASAGICRNMFAIIAMSSAIMPTNRNLPMNDRSRLIVCERTLMPKKMPPVPTAAYPTSAMPLRICSA
jgi:hypothetical protein